MRVATPPRPSASLVAIDISSDEFLAASGQNEIEPAIAKRRLDLIRFGASARSD